MAQAEPQPESEAVTEGEAAETLPEIGDMVEGPESKSPHIVTNIIGKGTAKPTWEMRTRYGNGLVPVELGEIDKWRVVARRGTYVV